MKSYTKLLIIKLFYRDISIFLVILNAIKKKMTKIKIVLLILFSQASFGQNEITIQAALIENGKKIDVSEEITVKNTSNITLKEIALNDWNHAFSSKKTALAKKLGVKISAEVYPFQKFWVAEDYHQDYEKNNPNNPYIRNVSIPRLNRFKSKFPELLKKNGH